MICFFLLVNKHAAIITAISKNNATDEATIGPTLSWILVPGSNVVSAPSAGAVVVVGGEAGVSIGGEAVAVAVAVAVTRSVDVFGDFAGGCSPCAATCTAMVKAKKFIFAKRFEGMPKVSDFKLVEEDLRELKDGEILTKGLWHSVDPYMRAYSVRMKEGDKMIGSQVAKIIESKHSKFPVNSLVVTNAGWCDYAIANGDEIGINSILPYPEKAIGNLSPSLALGAIGMPGNTAYFGLLDICEPKSGKTLVVSGAAGAVGSLVGQIGKIKGLRVIGFCGSDDKVAWLKNDLNFDYAYNYKKSSTKQSLKESAPNGVDYYFDNVGGPFSDTVINFMNDYGRISVCGAISYYNDDAPPLAPSVQGQLIFKQLRMEGFLVWRWMDRWSEGIREMAKWIQEGKIKYRETVTEGFENIPKAFIEMLEGKNVGKAIVKA